MGKDQESLEKSREIRRNIMQKVKKQDQILTSKIHTKVKCDWCGKTKLIYNWELKLKHHFCNLKCYGKWNSKNRIKKRHPRYLKRIKAKCDNCGKIYIRPPWYLTLDKAHCFCNRKCFHEWYKKNVRGKNSPSWKGGEKEVKCINCGKLFFVPKYKLKRNKHLFCGKKCVDE